ncbi:MAG TPA: DUF6788 family protein [Terrimicrobiaceae bacterium]
MSKIPWNLQQKKERLKHELLNNFDFLVGSVTTQGRRGGFNLTSGEKGKTRTKYIRRGQLEEVRAMIERHRKLKELLKELSEVNWELLKAKDPR